VTNAQGEHLTISSQSNLGGNVAEGMVGVLCAILLDFFGHNSSFCVCVHAQNTKEKMSNNSQLITLQISGQSPNLFSSNYIYEAKFYHSRTSQKQIMIQKTSPIIKPLPFTITNNKTASIYHMNRFLALLAHH
jgi:hypothetical protein